jgi:hypothetical protein
MAIDVSINTSPVTITVPSTGTSIAVATTNVTIDIDHGIWVDLGGDSVVYSRAYDKIRGNKNVPVEVGGTVITFSPAYADANYMKSYLYCTRTDEDGNVIEIDCSFTIINSSSFRVVPSSNGTLDWQTTYLG